MLTEKAGRAAQSRISKKISHLVKGEGVPQKQAVAMALDMERKGRLTDTGKYVPVKEGIATRDLIMREGDRIERENARRIAAGEPQCEHCGSLPGQGHNLFYHTEKVVTEGRLEESELPYDDDFYLEHFPSIVQAAGQMLEYGKHEGECIFDMPNGACSKHWAAMQEREVQLRSALGEALAAIAGRVAATTVMKSGAKAGASTAKSIASTPVGKTRSITTEELIKQRLDEGGYGGSAERRQVVDYYLKRVLSGVAPADALSEIAPRFGGEVRFRTHATSQDDPGGRSRAPLSGAKPGNEPTPKAPKARKSGQPTKSDRWRSYKAGTEFRGFNARSDYKGGDSIV